MNIVQDGSQGVPWRLRLGSILVGLAWAGGMACVESGSTSFSGMFSSQFGSGVALPLPTQIVLLVPPYGWLATGQIFGVALIAKDSYVEREWARSLNWGAAVVLGLDLGFIAMALFLPLACTLQGLG